MICDCRVVYAIVIVDLFMWFVIVGIYAVCDCIILFMLFVIVELFLWFVIVW